MVELSSFSPRASLATLPAELVSESESLSEVASSDLTLPYSTSSSRGKDPRKGHAERTRGKDTRKGHVGGMRCVGGTGGGGGWLRCTLGDEEGMVADFPGRCDGRLGAPTVTVVPRNNYVINFGY